MYDHNTQRPRGFGFITYDSEDAVDNVLVKTFHELNGKMVEVKRAVPKEQSPGSPMRSPIGGYTYNMNRINNLLNGYNQAYNPSPVTGYGMRMDMRLGQVSNVRGRFSQFNPGYGMGMNFDQGLTPGYGNPSNNNGINFARGINQFYTGNSPKFGTAAIYGSSNSPGPILSSSARNTWGNGGLNHMENSISENNNFLGSGNVVLGSNGGVNWGDSTLLGSGQSVGSNQSYGGVNLGHLTGDGGFTLGGSGYGRRSRNDSSVNAGYNGSYSDLYGGSSIYGDPTWRSSSLELEDSTPFDYGLANVTVDMATKSSDGYMGAFNIRQ